jgi:hypothetical protein
MYQTNQRRGLCPKCRFGALIETVFAPVDEQSTPVNAAIRVECTNPACDDYVAPPRTL